MRIAIFPWGDVIEEFLDPLGLTLHDYAERMRGGWLFGYVAGLQACGIEPVIVYASERVAQVTRLTHAETGALIVLVPGRRTGWGRTAERRSLKAIAQWARTPLSHFAQVLRTERCEAVLVQDYEHPRFDALALLARSLDLPVYASFQGGDVTLSPVETRARRRTLGLCAGLIVASARERQRLEASYSLAATVHDIPNPVDTRFWSAEPRQAARAELGIPPDTFLVFNHGRIDIHRKGLDLLLAAWREAAAPGRRLAIVGSGQDREAFAPLVASTPGVSWTSDYVTDPPRIRRWLSAADIYVTLSRIEGMPVAPLEAMACGLPVVASDAHGLADLFADGESSGGVLVPRDDAPAAAQAISALAGDAGRRARLGQAARAHAESRYSIAAVGQQLAAVISSGRRRRGPVMSAPSRKGSSAPWASGRP